MGHESTEDEDQDRELRILPPQWQQSHDRKLCIAALQMYVNCAPPEIRNRFCWNRKRVQPANKEKFNPVGKSEQASENSRSKIRGRV